MKKKETFTQKVKEEISQLEFKERELLPLLSGFIKINGSLSFNEREKCLVLRTENNKVAKMIYNSLKSCFDVNPSFRYSRKMKLNKNVVYHLIVKEKIDVILEELELSDGVFSIFPKKYIKDKQLRFFIAGAFLASGSINSPESTNYHLQITVQEESDAKKILRLLNYYKQDNVMDFKMLSYKNKYILYLKKADQIATFLSLICANDSLFEFENARITKDFLNSENRLNICITANYQRTIGKAKLQIEDINYIINNSDLSLLSEKEKALCELRLENPEASLAYLSDLLLKNYDIAISKSGVNHLFNTIHDKAENLKIKN